MNFPYLKVFSYIKEYSLDIFSYFSLEFHSCNLKQLIFQSKFSGTRKFTLRYQQFEINFNFEIWRADCITNRAKSENLTNVNTDNNAGKSNI